MVAVSSRFAVLATLCAVASVSYTPLAASAAAVEARHSDKKINESQGNARLAKQPVIPLPHKLSETSVREAAKANAVEHGRTHKNKKKEREEPAAQSVRLVQFPVRSAYSLYQRHHDDDDCPDKVVVNGDRDHVHLSCHHDHYDDHHDHHDHDQEIIVNGDRDHVRARREDIQSRSPRHARPFLQRRNNTGDVGSASNGPIGTVEVQGRDSSNGQPIRYGEFFAEIQGNRPEIKVSKTNRTSFRMVDGGSTSQSNNPKDNGVFLVAMIPGSLDQMCCTYDANPSSSMPMRLNNCQDGNSSSSDGHSSQRFSYDTATGRIGLIWGGLSNQTSSAQGPNSTVARRNDAQNGGGSGGGVDLIWLPTQNATARVEATSNGVQTQTVTVTVIAGGETGSVSATSAAREASATTMSTSTFNVPVSSVSPSLGGFSSTQVARASSDMGMVTPTSSQIPTPAMQSNGQAPSSTPSELKIEVSPGDSSSTGPTTPSSALAASPDPTPSDSLVTTSSGASWGVPVRDGEVIDPVENFVT